MGRPPLYDWPTLTKIEGAPCGLPKPCQGHHASAWALIKGEDFPATMSIKNLRAAMRTKGRHLGLKCHTASRKNVLQIQYYLKVDNGIQAP